MGGREKLKAGIARIGVVVIALRLLGWLVWGRAVVRRVRRPKEG